MDTLISLVVEQVLLSRRVSHYMMHLILLWLVCSVHALFNDYQRHATFDNAALHWNVNDNVTASFVVEAQCGQQCWLCVMIGYTAHSNADTICAWRNAR